MTTKLSEQVSLIDVYSRLKSLWILYCLLSERDASVNISHKDLPEWEAHLRFVDSKPYTAWRLIVVDNEAVGACYLSKQNEIGVQVKKEHQGKGYGKQAVKLLMEECGPRRYLANINPKNERSAELFKSLGFNLIQHTYERI